MSRFQPVDSTLAVWAERTSIRWYTEWGEAEVRTFYLNPNSMRRVQVAVDIPQNELTVVHVAQNLKGVSRLNRTLDFPTTVKDLPETLDKALSVANEWLSEGD